MSHFTVMVIGDDVEYQLAPFHEYECTGVDDEYVIDVDQTDEINSWLDETIYVGESKETGKPDYWFNVESAKEKLVTYTEMKRSEWFEATEEDLDAEIRDYFGAEKKDDGKYYRHTNPNAKWDWYQVGGRWSGALKLKDPTLGQLGDRSWTNRDQPTPTGYADITTKGNIDLEGMQAEIREKKSKEFDMLEEAIGDIKPLSRNATLERIKAEGGTVEDALTVYNDSEFHKAIKKYEKENDVEIGYLFGDIYEDFYLHLPLNQARVRYVETAALNALTPFAFVKDQQWVERGEMGWWACVSDEKDKDAWATEFLKMFKELSDDTLITMVDCHI